MQGGPSAKLSVGDTFLPGLVLSSALIDISQDFLLASI